MHLSRRRGRIHRVFHSQDKQGIRSRLGRGHTADTAGSRRDQLVDRELPCEQDPAIPEPRPTKSGPPPQFAIGYRLLAILKR
jgi:hypothetical protein